jgi:hypothetical protein
MTLCCTELTGSEYGEGFVLLFRHTKFRMAIFSVEVIIESAKINPYVIPA